MSEEAAVPAAGQLKSFIERIERLEEDKRTVSGDIKEVYSEAKSSGFDVNAMRRVVSLRRKSKQEREEEESIIETYMTAIGESV